MSSGTRIPKVEITGIYGAIVKRFSRKMLGDVPTALGVYWQHQQVLKAFLGLGQKADGWSKCDRNLKSLAHLAVASRVGCAWCLDFNYFRAYNEGLDMEKARAVPVWRESSAFTSLERDVLEYAEAMSNTPPTVTDGLSARLLDALGAPALVELTAYVAAANLTTRSNIALGIEAQGFAESCGLPPIDGAGVRRFETRHA